MTMLSLPERYEGPRWGWANGGVIAGTLAGLLSSPSGSAVEVRLSRPVPLETKIEAVHSDGTVALHHDGELLAAAHHVAEPPPEGPVVELARAREAQLSGPAVPADTHPASGCFVCGPAHPNGLHLQPGWVDLERTVAATVWQPPSELADERGLLPIEIAWGALDCPSWYGGTEGRMALLGTLRGRQVEDLRAGEEYIVTGWRTGGAGRKAFAGASIRTAAGELLASSSAIWIYPRTD